MSAFPPKHAREPPRTEASSSRASRNTLYGSTAYQREKAMAVTYGGGSSSEASHYNRGKTEFEVLKENLRFIREGEDPKDVTWEERIARAYESKLFKEFALIDLKHYKSKRIALRWRTAEEVVGAIGEETCGSLRCPYHNPLPQHLVEEGARMPQLQAFELPFTYTEAGETKTALVKVKVCHRCAKKLLFKPGQRENSERSRSFEREARHVKTERRESEPRSSVKREASPQPERNGPSRRRSRSPDRQSCRDRATSRNDKGPVQNRCGR